MAAALTDESETIYSVCSALVTALSSNTTIHDLMIHTMDDFHYPLLRVMQQCQGYNQVEKRIKILEHEGKTGKLLN